MREVEVAGVRVEMPSNSPIVLLREAEGTRFIPIWVGSVEASAIAFALEGVPAERPLTHDLLEILLETFEKPLRSVHITALRDGVFYATMNFDDATVDCRPSDAIAVALRSEAPILVSETVLDEVGVELPDEDGESSDENVDAESELEQFREFLDHINPEDFSS